MDRSPFATLLRRVFDDCGLLSRKEWAKRLKVTESAISQWTTDDTIPRPAHLLQIIEMLQELASGNPAAQTAVSEFARLAQLPASQVSPHSKRMGATLAHYLLRAELKRFHEKLSRLPIKRQEAILRILIGFQARLIARKEGWLLEPD